MTSSRLGKPLKRLVETTSLWASFLPDSASGVVGSAMSSKMIVEFAISSALETSKQMKEAFKIKTREPVHGALLSTCGFYRYELVRSWGDGKDYLMVIGLNPSTADAEFDDRTILRCIRFAKSWGYTALYMTNIFAFRATNPNVMKQAREPIGVDNDRHLKRIAGDAKLVLAAWGNHGGFKNRGGDVVKLLHGVKPLYCLRTTGSGAPQHPLYLPAELKPIPYIHECR